MTNRNNYEINHPTKLGIWNFIGDWHFPFYVITIAVAIAESTGIIMAYGGWWRLLCHQGNDFNLSKWRNSVSDLCLPLANICTTGRCLLLLGFVSAAIGFQAGCVLDDGKSKRDMYPFFNMCCFSYLVLWPRWNPVQSQTYFHCKWGS